MESYLGTLKLLWILCHEGLTAVTVAPRTDTTAETIRGYLETIHILGEIERDLKGLVPPNEVAKPRLFAHPALDR